jgi:hypothetical protein
MRQLTRKLAQDSKFKVQSEGKRMRAAFMKGKDQGELLRPETVEAGRGNIPNAKTPRGFSSFPSFPGERK